MSDDQNSRDDSDHKLMFSMLQQAVDKMDSIGQDVSKMDKKLDLHIQKTEYELKQINELDNVQNALLDQHIEGVNTLKKMFAQHENEDIERFKQLEEPKEFLKKIIRIVVTLGAIAGAVTAIVILLKTIK